MVGLFSPGKNQGEIFSIARQLEKYKIKFHFVGNQAMNYEHYWLPLMKHKPDNCVIWGERDDVDTFYAACDLFYFSSILELNPLSIKEALSYKLPCIFRNLHTYLDTYDNNSLVTYINDDLKLTKRIILEKLQPEFNEIPGWFAYQDLYADVVKAADNNDIFVEVGAWFGKSTNYMVQQIRESKKNIQFTTVDTWKGTEDEDIHQEIVGSFAGDIFYEFVNNLILSNNYGYVNMIKDTSKNASNQFQNNSIDFIMIDAGHSYEAVIEDLNIPEKCPILGITIKVGEGKIVDTSPSLDRIDNTKGYTKGNIQVISHQANTMKGNATPEELIKFANWVLKTYETLL
jgi:hypothetical protein